MSTVRRGRGMTLIEVLVSVALLAMLGIGMLSVFRTAQRSYHTVIRVDEASSQTVTAQRFLRAGLESSYPYRTGPFAHNGEHGLEGTADTLEFSSPAQLAAGADGYRRFKVLTAARADGLKDLRVESQLDRNTPAQPPTGDRSTRATETLLSRVAEVEWGYLDASGTGRWTTQWNEQELPSLVRLRIAFPPRDPRSWPDLVIAPRVTDSASCEFDVIAQTCRGQR